MDFRKFFNNKFLGRTFGDFASSMDNTDYSNFKETLKKNSSWYVPNFIFNTKDDVIHQLFDNIDGTSIMTDSNGNSTITLNGEKNNKLEKSELFDWVKMNYEVFTGKKISYEELENMKMSEFMQNVETFLQKGFKLKD